MDYKELAEDALKSAKTLKSVAGRMEFYAAAITDLLARAEEAEQKVNELERALSDASKIVNTMQESTIPFYRRRAEEAEAHCKRLNEYRENANEAAAKWEGMYYMAEARVEKAERERDAAVKYIRHYGWCAGCKYFRGVRGCAGPGLKNCTEQNDHYEFGQKEE